MSHFCLNPISHELMNDLMKWGWGHSARMTREMDGGLVEIFCYSETSRGINKIKDWAMVQTEALTIEINVRLGNLIDLT